MTTNRPMAGELPEQLISATYVGDPGYEAQSVYWLRIGDDDEGEMFVTLTLKLVSLLAVK